VVEGLLGEGGFGRQGVAVPEPAFPLLVPVGHGCAGRAGCVGKWRGVDCRDVVWRRLVGFLGLGVAVRRQTGRQTERDKERAGARVLQKRLEHLSFLREAPVGAEVQLIGQFLVRTIAIDQHGALTGRHLQAAAANLRQRAQAFDVDLDGAGRVEPALQVGRAGASEDAMGFAAFAARISSGLISVTAMRSTAVAGDADITVMQAVAKIATVAGSARSMWMGGWRFMGCLWVRDRNSC
jgi:hypothetical protein